MGRFDKINDDDVLEPGPPVPPLEPKTRPFGPQDLPADPREWLFAIGGGEDIGDLVIIFTPIAYWREFVAQIDEHVTEVLRPSLPNYLLNKEEMEATFLLSGAYGPEQRTSDQVEADLRARGFQEDQSFTNMVYGR